MRKLILLFIVLPSFIVTSDVWAGTYWVSPTGTATWANCQSATPLSGTACCSYSTANTNASAGDTVYYRGGTYYISSGSAIIPSNSGTSGNRIIFSAYTNEEVIFESTAATVAAVTLQNTQSYIKVTGMKFYKFYYHLLIGSATVAGGSHNEISYCIFEGFYSSLNWIASRIRNGASYNHIHRNSFGKYGRFTPNDESAVFGVGIEESTTDVTRYNLIEYNSFYHGGHHVVELHGRYNVFRFNNVRNDPWSLYNGQLWGNRVMYMVGRWPYIGRNLIHGNRIGYGGECADDDIGGSGGSYGTSYNIIRRNVIFQNPLYGMFVTSYTGGEANHNKIYNNTYWYNGWSTTGPLKKNWSNALSHGISTRDTNGVVYNNVYKNNIFYQNRNLVDAERDIVKSDYPFAVPSYEIIEGNWHGATHGNPKFVDISGTPDPDLIATQFDFRLQSDSGAIDKGMFLTTITSSSGSGTQFQVADAGYFFDGWGMSVIPTATIQGDEMQLEGQSQRARITNVDYSTNTITVDTSLTWTEGQGIALAYNGSAPDQGAYEYQRNGAPNPPQNLRILQ